MPSRALPSLAEAQRWAITPGSVTWRYASDVRTLLGAGPALILQVAHPTVAAGVREHSDFENDPWGRLLRTLDYVNLSVYGGAEVAAHTGRQVREMHKRIKGVGPDGRRYHALEPDAYAWVHATLAEAIITAHRRFGVQLTAGEVERFYAEWRALGRLLGVGPNDLPEGWSAFQAYVEQTVAERLEANDVVETVLRTLTAPKPPPLPLLSHGAWRVLRAPATRAASLATIGLLPALLRERLGQRWTAADEARLRVLGAALRGATPVMPRGMRRFGPSYLGWREGAIDRGQFAPPAGHRPLGVAR